MYTCCVYFWVECVYMRVCYVYIVVWCVCVCYVLFLGRSLLAYVVVWCMCVYTRCVGCVCYVYAVAWCVCVCYVLFLGTSLLGLCRLIIYFHVLNIFQLCPALAAQKTNPTDTSAQDATTTYKNCHARDQNQEDLCYEISIDSSK